KHGHVKAGVKLKGHREAEYPRPHPGPPPGVAPKANERVYRERTPEHGRELRMIELRDPRASKGKKPRARGRRDLAKPKPPPEEQITGAEGQRQNRDQPERVSSVRPEPQHAPEPVKRSDPEHRLAVSEHVLHRVERRKIPVRSPTRAARDPA